MSLRTLSYATLAWATAVWGRVALNREERTMRAAEEMIELAQAEGLPRERLDLIADRVYSRPKGDPVIEAGQVLVTMLGWCAATGNNPDALLTVEYERILSLDPEALRAKHRAKQEAGTALRETTVLGHPF